MNDDGAVNSIDALFILQFDADIISALPNAPSADVNRNGRINSVDATLVLQYEAGLLHTFPAGTAGRGAGWWQPLRW